MDMVPRALGSTTASACSMDSRTLETSQRRLGMDGRALEREKRLAVNERVSFFLHNFSSGSIYLDIYNMKVQLLQIAHARSGDKGDAANVGVIAREERFYPILKKTLTAALVKKHFKGICFGKVERYELPNLWALNFILHNTLGGGGTISLKLDAQGKTLSAAMLKLVIDVPSSAVAQPKKNKKLTSKKKLPKDGKRR